MDLKETGCDAVAKHDFVRSVRQILRHEVGHESFGCMLCKDANN